MAICVVRLTMLDALRKDEVFTIPPMLPVENTSDVPMPKPRQSITRNITTIFFLAKDLNELLFIADHLSVELC